MDSKAGSWFTSTNYIHFPNYYVQNKFAIIFQICDYKDEAIDTSITQGGNDVV